MLSHYTTFIGLRRRLRVVYSRKPFSGHLAAILLYANYKVKTQNSAWKPGSSHSACLNYVKKLVPHFYPKMHLDDYWRPFFRNPSSLLDSCVESLLQCLTIALSVYAAADTPETCKKRIAGLELALVSAAELFCLLYSRSNTL